jgi:predicted MFS family arabinose efflux permease
VKGFSIQAILRFSVWLFAISFAVLNIFPNVAFLWVGMLFATVGEMLNFPFMNRFANDRADRGKAGAYMGLFTVSWSVAHIIGHTLGLHLVAWGGFTITWYLFTGLLTFCVGLLFLLQRMLERERARLVG